MRKRIWVGLCLLLVLVAAGMLGVRALTRYREPAEAEVIAADPRQDPRGVLDLAYPSINELANEADLGIRGIVMSVGAPRWNSADGRIWTSAEGRGTPMLYREVMVRVTEVLFRAPGPRVTLGIRFRAVGTGENTGAVVHAGLRANAIEGPLVVGTDKLLLLNTWKAHDREGVTETRQISFGSRGQWTIEGEQAVSSWPDRSVPYAALRDRLLAERARGRVTEDVATIERTTDNPLG